MKNLSDKTLPLARWHLCLVQLVMLFLSAAGLRVFFTGAGKRGFDVLPLGWYLTLMLTPLIALVSFAAMWRVRRGSAGWIVLGGFLTAPQLYVLLGFWQSTLHYLGWF